MVCKNAAVVFDPSELFPPYGENSITANYAENKLVVSVFFDGANGERKISFIFENVFFHRVGSIPGVDDMTIECEKYSSINCLVDYQYSEFKNKWEEELNHLFKLKHFKMFFLNANKSLEVICETFVLGTLSREAE